jgi:hypothetical protein
VALDVLDAACQRWANLVVHRPAIAHLVGRPVRFAIGSADRVPDAISLAIDRPIGRMVSRLIHHGVSWAIDCAVGWLDDHERDRSV